MEHDGRNILLAEDDENLQRLVERILTRKGFKVKTFSDGASLEQFLIEEGFASIAAIITDYNMPGSRVSGGDLIKNHSETLKEYGIPMIGYSADSLNEEEMRSLGACAFVNKDMNLIKNLSRALREALDDPEYKK